MNEKESASAQIITPLIVALHPRVFQVSLFIFYHREGVAWTRIDNL
jgi:hypothetical protein